VPAGLADGLPVGLQIVAPRYRDGLVLRMAALLERLLDLHLTPVAVAR
jgi:Asp-tRNA(Asn)/Glu-tRNA(Gln) amidotransferase A subunit family amidase